MLAFLFGSILLIIPFILLGLFSDKKKGFIYVLFFLLLFQTVLALLSQLLGIFYYWTIVSGSLLADIIIIFIYFKANANNNSRPHNNFKGIDWVLIIVVIISLLSLYQVHYNYTGKISSATDNTPSYHQVSNMVYPYPYFSDEWYAVSLVEGAIGNHSLPVKNILNNDFFLNLELFFHSFIAQIILLLGMNPLLQYTMLSIFLNTLIIVLIYLFLRINSASKLGAGVCSLLALYIVSGGNLPGLWHLIPLNLGIIIFLLSICFIEFKDVKVASLSLLLSCFFYPPLIPFNLLAFLILLYHNIKIPKEYRYKIISITVWILSSMVFIFYILTLTPLAKVLQYIISRIIFISLVAPFMLRVNFYDIIPWPAILLAILGLYYVYNNKKSILLLELILGTVFWFFYSFTLYRFFIDYERIVIITSIIVVIIAGLGLFQLESYAKRKFDKNWYTVLKAIELSMLLLYLILLPQYTGRENWRNITAIDSSQGLLTYPKAPANNYLIPDDLRIFQGIKGKSFLSIPWKGTVIGIATGNYPILIKEGTISLGSQMALNNFLQADCQRKSQLVEELQLNYIYLDQINCPGFQEIDKSKEGFVLYKIEK